MVVVVKGSPKIGKKMDVLGESQVVRDGKISTGQIIDGDAGGLSSA